MLMIQKSVLLLLFSSVYLFANPNNQFFVMADSITLECSDVNEIKKIDDSMAVFYYSDSGMTKIHNFTLKYQNKKFGLIANESVIFMNVLMRNPLGEKKENRKKGFWYPTTFTASNKNIDKFLDTFKECQGVIKR